LDQNFGFDSSIFYTRFAEGIPRRLIGAPQSLGNANNRMPFGFVALEHDPAEQREKQASAHDFGLE
jgi:hypothetical protein